MPKKGYTGLYSGFSISFPPKQSQIANLVTAFSELSIQDLEEAKAVLRAAGKDPDLILENGLKALQKIKEHSNRSRVAIPTRVDSDSSTLHGYGTVIALKPEICTIDLVQYAPQEKFLKSEEVFETLIKQQAIYGIPYKSLIVGEEVRNLKFNKFLRELTFSVEICAESVACLQ